MCHLYFANETGYSEQDKKLFKAINAWLKLVTEVGVLLQMLAMHDCLLYALFNTLK